MEKLGSYKRQPETSLHKIIIDFDQNYNNLWRNGQPTEDLLGFKFLKAAYFTSHQEQLIKTTITDIKDYSTTKMIKSNVFNDTENHSNKSEEPNIKEETLLYARKLPVKDRDNEEEKIVKK